MQKIIPHFWYDKEAKEATALYASVFANSSIDKVTTIKDTPSGDADMVSFTLADQKFMAISGGPYFKLNPSISMFVVFDSEAEIEKVWQTLSDGGKTLMPYNTYPWAQKYGWIREYHQHNPYPVVGLREGTMISVEGDTMTLIGLHSARVFKKGKEPYEIEPGPFSL